MTVTGINKHRTVTSRPVSPVADPALPGTEYASLEAFRTAGGPTRARSVEQHFGLMWRDGRRKRPRYRISWIESTGEVYALALSEFDELRKVQLLGVVPTLELLERLLNGWQTLSYDESTLDWVRERVGSA
jgi:hypothetical protein